VGNERRAKAKAIEAAGHPVIYVDIADEYALGQEFFRWEMATAVAGAVLGVNPFDQPDVEAAKIVTRDLAARFEKEGNIGAAGASLRSGALEVFLSPKAPSASSLEGALSAFLSTIKTGDYFALLAFIERNDAHAKELGLVREAVLRRKKVATCLGFGPRFLHSTGQAYKGGPANGVFLQITGDPEEDLAVPGKKYTFGQIQGFQAQGDLKVLWDRDRRALRVHLHGDVEAGLGALRAAVEKALS
jgi:hypothetical protein